MTPIRLLLITPFTLLMTEKADISTRKQTKEEGSKFLLALKITDCLEKHPLGWEDFANGEKTRNNQQKVLTLSGLTR